MGGRNNSDIQQAYLMWSQSKSPKDIWIVLLHHKDGDKKNIREYKCFTGTIDQVKKQAKECIENSDRRIKAIVKISEFRKFTEKYSFVKIQEFPDIDLSSDKLEPDICSRTCVACGKSFLPKQADSTTCSKSCYHKIDYLGKRIERIQKIEEVN